MSATIYLENIQNNLFRLIDLIESSNSINRSNRTVDAENFFCSLLNSAFGWNLINANELKSNQDSFDLIDKKRKLYVQVTSNKKHSLKFNTTLSKFKKQDSGRYNRLIVLFIARKCPQNILKEVKEKKIQYEAFDIPKLYNQIYFKCKTAKKLQVVNDLLEVELAPLHISTGSIKANYSFKLPKQKIKEISAGIYINRTALVERIFAFCQSGSGLLVGGPGVGKSFTVEELQRLYANKRLPCFSIRINELVEGNDEEIKEEIGIGEKNWIISLKNGFKSSSKGKGLLIFDAFDTAKDERIRSLMLKNIQKAIKELTVEWSILVSTRTFDATKSTRLLELFPSVGSGNSITCRHLEIPELSEQELIFAIKANKKLVSIFENSSSQLKKLLKVPYFLKLSEKILADKNNVDKNELSQIETEEQLLKIYWDKKVVFDTRADIFLLNLTKTLVINENLSCKKSTILNELNYKTYDELISLGVLEESLVTKQNVSFTHNILLEYAISRYLIQEDCHELIQYVSSNQKMPFIFRQSFIYFYSRVWNVDAGLFWKHYFATRSINEPLFRLFHQTILNFTLGAFYSDIKQLRPVFDLSDNAEKGVVIRKILEGIRFINRGVIRDKDFDLLLECSKFISESNLWELGFLIDKAIIQAKANSNHTLLVKVAKASQNYLRFVLEDRKTSPNKWLIDSNGSMWAVQNACQTFSLQKNKIKDLLKQVLLILNEEDFSFRFLYPLTSNIKELFKEDPEFGKYVYQTIYYHNEVSDKETFLGGGVVLSLRSNRKQDFLSILYRLENDFENIIDLCPEISIKMGIDIVNKFSIIKSSSYSQSEFNLTVNGIKSKIISDFSFHDSTIEKEYGHVSHLFRIFKYIEKLLEEVKLKQAQNLLGVVVASAKATIVWRKLLKLLFDYPKRLKHISLGILRNKAIFICDETVYEAGELIKSIWPYLTAAERIQIESSIINLFKSNFKQDKDLLIARTRRLLSCIPASDLKSRDLENFILKYGKAEENMPIVSYSGLQAYSTSEDEKLWDLGVDSSNVLEMTAYSLMELVKPFNDKYDYNNSDKPIKEEFEPLIISIKELWQIAKSQTSFNERILFNCDYEVSRFAKIVSRNGGKLPKVVRSVVEDIAGYYIENKNYKEKSYEKGSIKHRTQAYLSTPRTAATSTFVQLLSSDKSATLTQLIVPLFSDNKSIVRYKALFAMPIFWHNHRDLFWEIIENRFTKESDGMCLCKLIDSVNYDNIIKDDKVKAERTALLAINNLSNSEDVPVAEIWQCYNVLLLRLLIKYNSEIAKNIIYDSLKNKSFARSLVFELLGVLDPHDKENNYVSNPKKYDYLVEILYTALKERFKSIQDKGLNDENIRDDFEVIDFCIQQLYYTVLQGKKSNRGKSLEKKNKTAFYFKIKPILGFVVDESEKIDSGFMVAHTGYYFMQLLNEMLYADPEFVLTLSSNIVRCAASNNFTYDQTTMKQIIKLAEQILVDHKEIISKPDNFDSLISILDQFANSGWQEALELTWRLKEIF